MGDVRAVLAAQMDRISGFAGLGWAWTPLKAEGKRRMALKTIGFNPGLPVRLSNFGDGLGWFAALALGR